LLGIGREVDIFENKLSFFFKRKVACVVNGTAALHLALQAIGIKKNDEVLVPSLTYLASYQAITAAGAKPISCDVLLNTGTIDINDAKKKITKKTKAIIPVHYAGGVGNLNEVYKFARKENIRIIEDAAHAFGSKYNDRLIGSQGDIVCFSFDGIKNITSGEGGCIVTNDKKIFNRVKELRKLGLKLPSKINTNLGPDVKEQGWRYHMSNLMASIGIEQLKRFSSFSKKRQTLAKLYDQYLIKEKKIILFNQDYKKIVPHIYPIRILGLKRRKYLINDLKLHGIEAGFHYFPNHKLSFFYKKGIKLRNTEILYPELLTLPLHPDVTLKDVNYICKTLIKILPKYS